ncbi:MAG: carboxypeptidase-like regulatory domain-containing protein, partial [Candidatus Neomarinimicrobiota bacterium]
MIRLVPLTLIIGLLFAVDKKGKEKTQFDVTGIVIGESGEGLKKVKLTIFNDFGEKVESGKTKKSGEFKFKKMKAGDYRIVCEHKEEGEVSVDFSITRKDVDLKIEFQSKLLDESPIVDDLNEVAVPLVPLPQQKEQKSNQQLKFDELFFEYESNLKALEIEVDSLKSVVKGYEKGQSMPNISREILDLIKIPETQSRIELQNGTVVSGEILQESDSTLTLNTRIGKLVLKKEMVVRMDELQKPGP